MEWNQSDKSAKDLSALQTVKLTGFTRLNDSGENGHFNMGYVHEHDRKSTDMDGHETKFKSSLCSRAPKLAVSKRKFFSRKVLYKRLPIIPYLKDYTTETFVSDLLAGLTVGLTVIPQAIAYANVAGIPSEYGLYSSFLGCFIYAIFGSVKDSPIGPTAIMAILTRENLHELNYKGAILLAFLTGIVQLILGMAQSGFVVDFISGPVSVGFTSAAAIIIATTQIKDLLGLTYSASQFLDVWDQLACHIKETKKWDALLGVLCMIVLLLLRKIKDIPIGPKDVKDKKTVHKIIGKLLWFISTARNILVVVICAIIAYVFQKHGSTPFVLSGYVKEGLPPFKPPPFEIQQGNKTFGFLEICSQMSTAIVVLPLLSLLEDISLAKVFSNGKTIDATQELLALGLCNVASSFVGSMPISGALSRGAVNNASGARTPIGGIYTGIVVLLSLQFFTPYFQYIPKASLAAVIIAAVLFMVEFHVVKPIWRANNLIPAAATFLCCLLVRLELGIVIGIGINVLFLLYASARPSVQVEKHSSEWGCDYLVITPDRSLVFPSVEYVRNNITKAGVRQGSSSIPVVIDSRHVQGADFTAAKGVKSLIDDFYRRNQPLLFYNLKPSVVEVFQAVQPVTFQHCSTENELNQVLRSYSNKSCVI